VDHAKAIRCAGVQMPRQLSGLHALDAQHLATIEAFANISQAPANVAAEHRNHGGSRSAAVDACRTAQLTSRSQLATGGPTLAACMLPPRCSHQRYAATAAGAQAATATRNHEHIPHSRNGEGEVPYRLSAGDMDCSSVCNGVCPPPPPPGRRRGRGEAFCDVHITTAVAVRLRRSDSMHRDDASCCCRSGLRRSPAGGPTSSRSLRSNRRHCRNRCPAIPRCMPRKANLKLAVEAPPLMLHLNSRGSRLLLNNAGR